MAAKDSWGRTAVAHAVLSGRPQVFDAVINALREEIRDDEVRGRLQCVHCKQSEMLTKSDCFRCKLKRSRWPFSSLHIPRSGIVVVFLCRVVRGLFWDDVFMGNRELLLAAVASGGMLGSHQRLDRHSLPASWFIQPAQTAKHNYKPYFHTSHDLARVLHILPRPPAILMRFCITGHLHLRGSFFPPSIRCAVLDNCVR